MEHVGGHRSFGWVLTGRYSRRKAEQNDVSSIKAQIIRFREQTNSHY